ncbi:MAG TPA: GAF domain-containing sensor histidine kinase [Gaiellaceae bacterium]|nr:GAF domain-containing sensor histidine kinase [Gaiellaceae bacterium]
MRIDAPMTLGRLKWLAIVLPTLFLTSVWILLHDVAIELHRFPGILVLFPVTVLAVAVFAFGVFAVVSRLERRIVDQNRELEQRTSELEAVLAVGRAAASSLELEELLEASMDAILEVTGADVAEVWVRSSHAELTLAGHRGLDGDAFAERTRFRLGEGLPGLTAAAGAPVVVRDLEHDPRVAREALRTAGFEAYVGLPLKHREEIVGTLGVAAMDAAELATERELSLLDGIGQRVAVAIVNARLHERVLDGAVLEERVRIARDLHDGLAQVLGYINTQTQAVKRLVAVGNAEGARAELDAMEEAARAVYADVREAILGLRTSLPRQGLVPSLRQYLDEFSALTGVECTLDLGDGVAELEPPPEVEIQVTHIVQEALANVRKHSSAENVTVGVDMLGAALTVRVVDDGRGFDPEAPPGARWPRFGLQTMRERAEAVGGEFVVESSPGSGTRVEVIIPVSTPKEVARASRAG